MNSKPDSLQRLRPALFTLKEIKDLYTRVPGSDAWHFERKLLFNGVLSRDQYYILGPEEMRSGMSIQIGSVDHFDQHMIDTMYRSLTQIVYPLARALPKHISIGFRLAPAEKGKSVELAGCTYSLVIRGNFPDNVLFEIGVTIAKSCRQSVLRA